MPCKIEIRRQLGAVKESEILCSQSSGCTNGMHRTGATIFPHHIPNLRRPIEKPKLYTAWKHKVRTGRRRSDPYSYRPQLYFMRHRNARALLRRFSSQSKVSAPLATAPYSFHPRPAKQRSLTPENPNKNPQDIELRLILAAA